MDWSPTTSSLQPPSESIQKPTPQDMDLFYFLKNFKILPPKSSGTHVPPDLRNFKSWSNESSTTYTERKTEEMREEETYGSEETVSHTRKRPETEWSKRGWRNVGFDFLGHRRYGWTVSFAKMTGGALW